MKRHLLTIDQGTSSTRATIFDERGQVVCRAQEEFTQHFPHDGWVEHDALEIWRGTLSLCKAALDQGKITHHDIAAIGITNQRETVVLWDRVTGEPLHRAIVWLDRRTSPQCDQLRRAGAEPLIQEKTGLLIDPYFSATKIRWLLDHIPGARARAERGELACGTIDSFLLWQLTDGTVHATDPTNASRTLLFDIHSLTWDDELCALFDIPLSILPEVRPTSGHFGTTDPSLFGSPIPITALVGDQQAALVGQGCLIPGTGKCTYGTGLFLVVNTGTSPVTSHHRLLTTVGYHLKDEVTYALEGSSFVAGAALQWLRDGLKLFDHASATESLAADATRLGRTYFVPAFSGLGAPYWDPDARGALLGITRDTSVADVVAAALLSVAYQTRDLVEAMQHDGAEQITSLRVDGGMVQNGWFMQCLADVLNIPVTRPAIHETTSLGAAYLAGLSVGIFSSLEQIVALWREDRTFTPNMRPDVREQLYNGWKDAVARVRTRSDL
jgi:glycerol kinase